MISVEISLYFYIVLAKPKLWQPNNLTKHLFLLLQMHIVIILTGCFVSSNIISQLWPKLDHKIPPNVCFVFLNVNCSFFK